MTINVVRTDEAIAVMYLVEGYSGRDHLAADVMGVIEEVAGVDRADREDALSAKIRHALDTHRFGYSRPRIEYLTLSEGSILSLWRLAESAGAIGGAGAKVFISRERGMSLRLVGNPHQIHSAPASVSPQSGEILALKGLATKTRGGGLEISSLGRAVVGEIV